MKNFVLFISIALLSACSTAGPFITNISSNGNNSLVVEKCSIHFNSFTGIVSTQNCINSTINVK